MSIVWSIVGAVLLLGACLFILSASIIITLCLCWAFALAVHALRVSLQMWRERNTPPQWGDRVPLAGETDTADGAGRGLPHHHRSAR